MVYGHHTEPGINVLYLAVVEPHNEDVLVPTLLPIMVVLIVLVPISRGNNVTPISAPSMVVSLNGRDSENAPSHVEVDPRPDTVPAPTLHLNMVVKPV
jgi:hypothetical protein